MKLINVLFVLALAFALSGCGTDDQATAPPPPEPEQPAQAESPPPERAEPAGTPSAPQPTEHDTVTGDQLTTDARPAHEPARIGRDDAVEWWDDEALVEQLGLDPDQRAELLEVREALHQARLEGRTQLDDLHAQSDALEGRDLEAEADRERLAELRTSMAEVEERMDEAENLWQETVHSTLRPEQLEQLEDLLESQP